MKQYPVLTTTLPGGEELAYRIAGTSGKTVVLVHGNMSSSVHWQPTMEALENDYIVIAPDLRGFGDSSYLAGFDSLRELADDLLAFLDRMEIGPCTLVGWSTGGGIIMEMAASRSQQIEKIILLESVPPTGYPMFKKDETGAPIHDQPLTTREEVENDPIQVRPVLNAYAAGDREFMRATWNAVIYNLRQPPAEDYELYLDAIMKQRNLVDIDYSLVVFNMTNDPTPAAKGSGRINDIQCPVVILHGEKDLVVPFSWAEGTLAAFGNRAKLVPLAGCGHSPMTDDPELFFSVLKAQLV